MTPGVRLDGRRPRALLVAGAVAVMVAAALTAGCGSDKTEEPVEEFVVSGIAVAGPTCPVEQDPPDPNCADRAVPGAVIVVMDGDESVGEATTDASGRFTLSLPAGSYTLVPQPVEGLLGTAPPVDVTVPPDANDLVIGYDTGIR